MKNFFKAFLLLPLLAFSACSSEVENPTRMIFVDSIPQGAEVIVNSFSLGKTPISIEVEATDDGYFPKRTQITAIAQSKELFTQVVSYPPYSPANPALSEIPETITFDMRTSAAQKQQAGQAGE